MHEIKRKYYEDNPNNALYLEHSPDIIKSKLKYKTSKQKIKKCLQEQRNYTLFKQQTGKKNERNFYQIYLLDEIWQADLIELSKLQKHNSGIVYTLVCIDCFSRYAFARSLPNKQQRSVIKAFIDIFKVSNRKPRTIQTDAGKEFIAKDTQHFLKKEDIKFRIPITTLPAKCAFIESFNRTLKQRISRLINWKKITNQHNPLRYIDSLQVIMDNYNRTKHSSIKMSPASVNKSNAAMVYDIVRAQHKKTHAKNPRYKENDFVRVIRKRDTFEKPTMTPRWSEEIFRIRRVIKRKPYPVYELIDFEDRVIEGKLYEREIQKINLPNETPIKILKKPSIYNKNKQIQFKLLNNSTQFFSPDDLLKAKKENNYSDVVRKLKIK